MNKLADDIIANNNQIPYTKEQFNELFLKELIECIEDTTKRISLKNKKTIMAKKLGNLENDIDWAIDELGNQLSSKDFKLTRTTSNTNTAAIEYEFIKDFNGYIDLNHYYLYIRKYTDNSYAIKYSKNNWGTSNWLKVKKDIKPDEMKELILDILEPYIEIPSKAKNISIEKFLLP